MFMYVCSIMLSAILRPFTTTLCHLISARSVLDEVFGGMLGEILGCFTGA